MNDKPILLNTEMVRATWDGRKTNTRRIFKLPKGMEWYDELGGEKAGWFCDTDGKGWWEISELSCPYGQPGDLLWVRETCREDVIGSRSLAQYEADDSYVIQGSDEAGANASWWYSKSICPSIHMPRWASRLTLRITNIRVERVQEISEEESVLEGVEWDHEHGSGWKEYGKGAWPGVAACVFARDSFKELWNSINGPDAWDRNDWVWCIEFSVIKKNIDEVLRLE